MPRLRKIRIEKYQDFNHELSDEDLIDISNQEEIITNFRKSNNRLKDSKIGKTMFQIYIGITLMVNFCLVTIPYYRTGRNSIISSIACIMTFLPVFFAYSTITTTTAIRYFDYPYFQILQNKKFIILMVMIYTSIIVIFKFMNGFISADLVYLLPILITYSIIDLNCANNLINKSIEELEKFKYDYKEA